MAKKKSNIDKLEELAGEFEDLISDVREDIEVLQEKKDDGE
jgi:DNA-binding ferritin-like protein